MRQIAVNEAGLRIGESHQHAELTDAEVETIRELNEGGMSYAQGLGWKAIAERMGVDRIPYRWQFWCKLERQGRAR